MITFDQYLQRKQSFHITYKGIALERCLTFDLYQVDGWRLMRRDLGKLRRAFDLSQLQISSNHFLATYGLQYRADHHSAFDFVCQQLPGEVICNNLYELPLVKHSHWLLAFGMLFQVLSKSRGWGLNLQQRLYLWCQTVLFCNSIDRLEQLDLREVKGYVAMYSSHHLENLLTQWMKLKGIKTYGLNEGVLVHYTHNIPIDAVTYENFECDKMYTWGQYTKDEFIAAGVPAERLEVGGYPHAVKEAIAMLKENPLHKVVVLLARGSYDATNRTLLNILADKAQLQVCLKMHPVSDIAGYTAFAETYGMRVVPKEQTVNDCLSQSAFDFAIAVNTSAYYESLMKGVPCLRFCDGSFDLMPGCDDVFGDAAGFESRMAWLKGLPIEQYQQEVNKALSYAIGFGINNYSKIQHP